MESAPQPPPSVSGQTSNVVLVGKKPVMNYVVACVTSFNQGTNTVTLIARGMAISKAVEITEVLRRGFIRDLRVKDIAIGTESVEKENRKSNVSTMRISLEKPAAPA